ncbi:DUF6416 domain-containing protein [Streptomyces dysideae]|uniref:Uncharacterized protein n=1 Tax=Streptomyces dysideae TaxID=909626 RepID=A0A101V3Q7_9ACTN|nr:DUF6416 domain-containing protein [Streptomyces dysideae]KUO21942.1 hypothetical protein AQJ91_07380 [Streptomyces dysideae]
MPRHITEPPGVTAGRARKEAGRRFLFHWWEAPGGADYAVKESVADLFSAALKAETRAQQR